MPAGSYDPSDASVVFFGDPSRANSGAESFAEHRRNRRSPATKRAEDRWSSFERKPFCAQNRSSIPASNTMKLKRGDSKAGQHLREGARRRGRATEAKWTLLDRSTPSSPLAPREAASPTVPYTVTKAPSRRSVEGHGQIHLDSRGRPKTLDPADRVRAGSTGSTGTFGQRTILGRHARRLEWPKWSGNVDV